MTLKPLGEGVSPALYMDFLSAVSTLTPASYGLTPVVGLLLPQFLAGVILWFGIYILVPCTLSSYLRKCSGESNRSPTGRIEKGFALLLLGSLLRLHWFLGDATSPIADAGVCLALYGTWVVDRRTLFIPDRFHLLGLGSALCSMDWSGSLGPTLLSQVLPGAALLGLLLVLGAIYKSRRGLTGLGMGDLKLLAWLSLASGSLIVWVFLVSCILGLLVQIPKVLTGRPTTRSFAFAPYIITGWLGVLGGGRLFSIGIGLMTFY